jgi:hypothetical protein
LLNAVSSKYAIAPIFLIRMAGVPFDEIRAISTSKTSAIARELIAARERFFQARQQVQDLLALRDNGFSPNQFHSLRSAIKAGRAPDFKSDRMEIITYREAVETLLKRENQLQQSLESELTMARSRLLESAKKILPRYLIFAGSGTADLLSESFADQTGLPARNKRARERERHLLLYLQRITTKNDTFSEFGPSGWGRIDSALKGVAIAPAPGIAKRDAFLERWTAHAVAAVINADDESPDVEVPAMEPYAFRILYDDVANWSSAGSRKKWLSILQPLAELPQKFAAANKTDERRSILAEARARLDDLGVSAQTGTRFLYSASNPIGEECSRECRFAVSETLVNEVADEAARWIDLWRDSYAFIASRVAAGLRRVFDKVAAGKSSMPMLAFSQACEEAKLPLTGPGLVALAVIGFQEVKAAFRQRLQTHADKEEYELTAEDCHFVRNNFEYPSFDEYTYPSADLQLSAASPEAVGRGDYQWILAELHPPVALLHHGGYWSCPDKTALNRALAQTVANKPNFYFGFFAADFTAHTTVRLFDALPNHSYFVAPQRGNPKWQTVSPADAEVFVDSDTGDVCLRKIASQEYLGSFARAWVIPLGFHPFQFSLGAHTPRLRCGRVIVQRRGWTVREEEFPLGDYNGVSRDLVVAIEQLRADKNWPRYVYVRPTEQALRRSGAEGRDKDTKPVFIDLENYLCHEVFHRWLVKAGEIEVTEMLPDPDHLVWSETDGRRTFELRTLVVPRP